MIQLPIFHRPFSALDLIAVLQKLEQLSPRAQVGRSREGTGNLCIYDNEGDYIGIVELHDPPELLLFDRGHGRWLTPTADVSA